MPAAVDALIKSAKLPYDVAERQVMPFAVRCRLARMAWALQSYDAPSPCTSRMRRRWPV